MKNGTRLEYTITRPATAAEFLDYTLARSDASLTNWASPSMTTSILSSDGAEERVRLSIVAGGTGNSFVRLRVTRK